MLGTPLEALIPRIGIAVFVVEDIAWISRIKLDFIIGVFKRLHIRREDKELILIAHLGISIGSIDFIPLSIVVLHPKSVVRSSTRRVVFEVLDHLSSEELIRSTCR